MIMRHEQSRRDIPLSEMRPQISRSPRHAATQAMVASLREKSRSSSLSGIGRCIAAAGCLLAICGCVGERAPDPSICRQVGQEPVPIYSGFRVPPSGGFKCV